MSGDLIQSMNGFASESVRIEPADLIPHTIFNGKNTGTFKISKKYDEDRSKGIKKDCDALLASSQNLRAMTNTLQSKIDSLENIMGIYSGK